MFPCEFQRLIGLSSWRPVTFSSGSTSPDFICLLSTFASRVVVTLPSAGASRVVCFLSTVVFLLKDSVSRRFDTRYFTFSPAKSSVELLLSLYQSVCSPQQSRIYFLIQWLIGLTSQYFNHLFLSIVCRTFVVAVSPVEYSFNPQYGRMMALAFRERIDFLTACDPQ
jgi:hypothetical protein